MAEAEIIIISKAKHKANKKVGEGSLASVEASSILAESTDGGSKRYEVLSVFKEGLTQKVTNKDVTIIINSSLQALILK